MPGRRAPLVLDHSTPELQLLQRVRDEAHRFAITHHRIRRDRAMTGSLLDELPGSAPRASGPCSRTSARPRRSSPPPARSCRRSPACPRRSARELHAHMHRAGLSGRTRHELSASSARRQSGGMHARAGRARPKRKLTRMKP